MSNQDAGQQADVGATTSPSLPVPAPGEAGLFNAPTRQNNDYTDGRAPGEWESKYPPAAKGQINFEAGILLFLLLFWTSLSGVALALSNQSLQIPLITLTTEATPPPLFTIEFRWLAIYFAGGLGGTVFSIKWLVHAVAKRSWHLDRRYWRLFVPMIGGVYASVVLALLDGGVIGGQTANQSRPAILTTAFAFLVGYFSDGVSGLLSNIANAVFGTLEKK
jgi:hypothetical protein